MTRRVLIGLAAAAALAMLAARAAAPRAPSHDGAISFIAATGHQSEYGERAAALEGRWVRAGEWQALAQPPEALALAAVSRGLAETDVHPPLYFWLLHILCWLVGPSLGAALLLDLVLVVATAFATAALARRAGCSPPVSGAAALLWLGGGASAAALAVRPYALLALAVAAAAAALLAFLERPGWRPAAALFASAVAGLLTHFHFGIALAGAGGFAALVLAAAGRWRPLAALAGVAIAATAAAWLLHPDFLDSIARLRAQTAAEPQLGYRAARSARSVLELWLPRPLARWPLLALLGAGLAAAAALAARRGSLPSALRPRALPAVAGVAILAALAALYLAGASPRHAMGPRYLVPAAPLLAVALAQLAARRSALLAVALAVAVVALAVPGPIRELRRERPLPAGPPLIVDSIARGDVVRAVWTVPPATRVLAAGSAAELPALEAPALQLVRLGRGDVIEELERRGYRRVREARSEVGPLIELRRR